MVNLTGILEGCMTVASRGTAGGGGWGIIGVDEIDSTAFRDRKFVFWRGTVEAIPAEINISGGFRDPPRAELSSYGL